MFARDILRGSKPGVFDIHLDEYFSKAIVEFLIDINTAIHLGRLDNFTLSIALQARINTADIFTADTRDAGYRCTDGKMFPVYPGNFG